MSVRRTFTSTQVIATIAVVALAAIATNHAWRDIWSTAVDREDQSHILLALPVAIWLAAIRRQRLRFCAPASSWLGALGVATGLVLSEVGFRQGADLFWHGGAVLAATSAAVSVVGLRVVRKFLPAFLALGFLLPVPGRLRHQIAVPMQEISAKVTEVVLDIAGFPISRSGNVLVINEQTVAVAEACNGMRMVGALALVTFAFAFAVPMRNWVRLVLLALSPLIAILVNIIRLIFTVTMYGYTSRETAAFLHDISGWAVLVVALGILWCVLSLLRWLEFRTVNYAVST